MISVTKAPQNVMEDSTMRLMSTWLLFVSITSASALNETELRGCNLVIPHEVQIRPEPQPDGGPLRIYTGFNIFRLGDVPDSGGSYGMDLLQVEYTDYTRTLF